MNHASATDSDRNLKKNAQMIDKKIYGNIIDNNIIMVARTYKPNSSDT